MNIAVIEPHAEILTPHEHIAAMPGLLEAAGRTCYKSDAGTDTADDFVRRIINAGHESVVEHASITVRIVCSRACSHQLVRHRLGAYSQESQRYCDYGGALRVIAPPDANVAPQMYHHMFPAWLQPIADAYSGYLCAREQQVRPEDARFYLPNACATEVVTTYNLRQWRHVFTERALNKRAQWEIRGIMLGLLAEFGKLLPCVFGDLAIEGEQRLADAAKMNGGG